VKGVMGHGAMARILIAGGRAPNNVDAAWGCRCSIVKRGHKFTSDAFIDRMQYILTENS